MKKILRKPPCILPTLFVALLLGSFISCEKENDLTPNQDMQGNNDGNDTTPTPQPLSKRSLIANKWVLYETYENNVIQTVNGTDSYHYTYDGAFRFLSNGNWTDIGIYGFIQDSTAFDLLFVGTNNPIRMNLARLDENELHTQFITNGNNFLYKYRR